jgi:hypothetical protein
MTRKLLTIGALGLLLAVSACRNPDDRFAQAETPVAGAPSH